MSSNRSHSKAVLAALIATGVVVLGSAGYYFIHKPANPSDNNNEKRDQEKKAQQSNNLTNQQTINKISQPQNASSAELEVKHTAAANNNNSSNNNKSIASNAPASQSILAPSVAPAKITNISLPAGQSARCFSTSDPVLYELLKDLPGVQCSAGGKVLVTGGYLVLFNEYDCGGLVLGLNARFHSTVYSLTSSLEKHLVQLKSKPVVSSVAPSPFFSFPIFVYSPQRSNKLCEYRVDVEEVYFNKDFLFNGAVSVQKIPEECEDNKFVQNSLHFTLLLLTTIIPASKIKQKLQSGLLIHLKGDYQFYSAEEKHQNDNEPINLDNKTGLGSSACLTASLIGSLFELFELFSTQNIIYYPATNPNNNNHQNITEQSLMESNLSFQLIQNSSSAVFFRLNSLERQLLAHNLAQLVHCLAQGKIGSGFDISAAFFGNHKYKRFSAEIIQPIINNAANCSREKLFKTVLPNLAHSAHSNLSNSPSNQLSDRESNSSSPMPSPDSQNSSNSLSSSFSSIASSVLSGLDSSNLPNLLTSPKQISVDSGCALCKEFILELPAWDNDFLPLELPQGMQLVLCDVAGGSKTPAMVQKVLNWRRDCPEKAKVLFGKLNSANNRVEAAFRSLASNAESSYYASTIAKCCLLPSQQWSWLNTSADYSVDETIIQVLLEIRASFAAVRGLLREISAEAGVEIEPAEQTVLCDFTENLPGVLVCGVPGAGGNDAIFAILLHDSVTNSVEKSWREFADPAKRNLRKLPLQQASSGIQTQLIKHNITAWNIFM
jgi:phosphomevalonate kinase